MADSQHRAALIQAAAALVAPALTDTAMARRLMGQPAQPGAKATDIWEMFDHVLAQLERRMSSGTHDAAPAPSASNRELYVSANGDRWKLVNDAGRLFVRHEPNVSSGGKASDIEFREFLARGNGPEQQALLQVLGSLA